MTRPAKKQKVAEEPTPVYVADQAFHNSLQSACVKIEEQREHLVDACHLIQHPHAHLLDDESLDVEKTYERSIDSAIKAWRSATAAYSTLFATLLNPSHAQPYTSFAERHHNELAELFRASLLAKTSAHDFRLHEETIEAAAEATKPSNDSAEPPNTSNPALKRNHSSLNGNIDAEPIPVSATANHVVPKVEYEDISAQVDARLQAKKAKKEAAKKEKKRKRESGESLAEGKFNGIVDKPIKKKVKGGIAGKEASGETKYDKRRKHEQRDEEAEDGASQKKRKKT